LDLVTVEDLGKEIFAAGVNIGWKKGQGGMEGKEIFKHFKNILRAPSRLCTVPVNHRQAITILDGGIK